MKKFLKTNPGKALAVLFAAGLLFGTSLFIQKKAINPAGFQKTTTRETAGMLSGTSENPLKDYFYCYSDYIAEKMQKEQFQLSWSSDMPLITEIEMVNGEPKRVPVCFCPSRILKLEESRGALRKAYSNLKVKNSDLSQKWNVEVLHSFQNEFGTHAQSYDSLQRMNQEYDACHNNLFCLSNLLRVKHRQNIDDVITGNDPRIGIAGLGGKFLVNESDMEGIIAASGGYSLSQVKIISSRHPTHDVARQFLFINQNGTWKVAPFLPSLFSDIMNDIKRSSKGIPKPSSPVTLPVNPNDAKSVVRNFLKFLFLREIGLEHGSYPHIASQSAYEQITNNFVLKAGGREGWETEMKFCSELTMDDRYKISNLIQNCNRGGSEFAADCVRKDVFEMLSPVDKTKIRNSEETISQMGKTMYRDELQQISQRTSYSQSQLDILDVGPRCRVLVVHENNGWKIVPRMPLESYSRWMLKTK